MSNSQLAGGRGRFNRNRNESGGGRGHGQRQQNFTGGNNNNNNNKTTNKTTNKNTTIKQKMFEPYSVGNQHIDTYDSVLESYLTMIQKTFTDGIHIVRSIRESDWSVGRPIKPSMPRIDLRKRDDDEQLILDVNGNTMIEDDEVKKETIKYEYEVKKIEYSEDLHLYNYQIRLYEDNKTKAYAKLINNFCSKVMKNQIEEKPDFKTNVRDDPIEALNCIRDYMYVPTRAKYEYDILTECVKRLIVDMKQEDTESLIDYTKRFKQAKKIFKTSFGIKILHSFAEKMKYYHDALDDAERERVKKESHTRWMTLLFMCNANQRKYGGLMSDLKQQYALNNDQYPKTLEKALDVLNNYKWDEAYSKH